MQTSNTEWHTLSNVPNNGEHTGIIVKTPIIGRNGHIDKTDENINTQTWYGRIIRKPDRPTHH